MPNFTPSDLLYIIPSFIVAIVILVGFHELGHFWMARRLGIRVLKFSIGFGKPLWKKVSKKDGVEYVVASIPLGGYVKLLGERNDDDQPIAEKDLPYAFNRAPVWKRVLVLLAGPMANLILAAFIYWILLMVGMPALRPVVGDVVANSVAAKAGLHSDDLIVSVRGHDVRTMQDALVYLAVESVEDSIPLAVRGNMGADELRQLTIQTAGMPKLTDNAKMADALGFEFWVIPQPMVIAELVSGGAAERAGLKVGDVILEMDGNVIDDYPQLIKYVQPRANRLVNAKIKRGTELITLPITVGADEKDKSRGKIGVGPYPPAMQTVQKYGFGASIPRAFLRVRDACALDLKVIGQMLLGKLSVKNLSGTVGIAEATGQAARAGLPYFISFLAFISVNLGILNLLPIPVLDGGQIVYQLIELVKGSPVSERVQLVAQQIGLAALLMLISLTLYNDIARHLS